MQFSLVGEKRSMPFPKGKGICEICGSETVSKCGPKVIWHWAHKSKQKCDPWWENETPWHREWKEKFPEDYREVAYTCPDTGEIHRADIATERGMFLEIQNSPMSLEELKSREGFYKNLVWLVNAEKFHSRFNISEVPLPNPNDPEFEDFMFSSCGNLFWKRSEYPDAEGDPNAMVELYSAHKVQSDIDKSYIGHHPFTWTRPHQAWVRAECPVMFDFGGDFVWRLENYRNRFHCVRAIHKEKFIWDVMHEDKARDIASRFYPISSSPLRSN